MNNIIISAKKVSKVYKLYKKPSYRVLDMCNLLRTNKNNHYYNEYKALNEISIDIFQGEKVAIIGRNGAGKSTFLKLVTKVISPSAGELKIYGNIQALLQIGAGFHPEFTGRENVLAYFSHFGLSTEDAQDKLADVLEFCELETYIDQPLKVYSTGMAMRLMFAASTAIQPNILVLDEVLSVGDAYFSKKSFDRIEKLCNKNKTTLLLVSHEIYSAAKLCNRMVWIDQGKIILDADPTTTIKAYEDSIRLQEEERLRIKKRNKLLHAKTAAHTLILVEISIPQNRPLQKKVYFKKIAILINETRFELPLTVNTETALNQSGLIFEGCNWGDVETLEHEWVRPMNNYDSVFHKVSGFVFVETDLIKNAASIKILEIECFSEAKAELIVTIEIDKDKFCLGSLNIRPNQWHTQSLNFLNTIENPNSQRINVTGKHGSGAIEVDDLQLINAEGKQVFEVIHGKPMIFRISYHIKKENFNECPELSILIFRKDNDERICHFITRDLQFNSNEKKSGIINLHIPKCMLGTGNYYVSIFIGEHGYYINPQDIFYTINPKVYLYFSEILEFKVATDNFWPAVGAVFIAEGHWTEENLVHE